MSRTRRVVVGSRARPNETRDGAKPVDPRDRDERVPPGSAGAFYAVTIIQPTRDLGVAVFANAGGDRAAKAASDAVKALIRRFAKPG